MPDSKAQQMMFSVYMFANTIVVDPMQIGLEGKVHLFNEIVRYMNEVVDLEPPSEVPTDELGTFKRSMVLQMLLDAISQQSKNGQEALVAAELSFVELAKGCKELRNMLSDYLSYYESPKKMFEHVENAEEVTLVKRLAEQVFNQ